MLIPLAQHFFSYNGPDVSTTGLRLIAIKPFDGGYWAKLDAIAPYDWENKVWRSTVNLQFGYNLGPTWAIYADGFVGIGHDRPYDFGAGVGLRFKY